VSTIEHNGFFRPHFTTLTQFGHLLQSEGLYILEPAMLLLASFPSWEGAWEWCYYTPV